MAITSLGYIGVNSEKSEDWQSYASGFLGMMAIDRGKGFQAFRMDNYQQRLMISRSSEDNPGFLGWEVSDTAALDRLAARLSDNGVELHAGSAALADQRAVGQLVWFLDPEGNRNELFVDPLIDKQPFKPGRAISGFKTGPYGMGHAVITVADADRLMVFYRDLLGFKVSDYGKKPVPLYFFHVNGRHHTFAMVGAGKAGFHHFMVEYDFLDDVGQGYDLALRGEAEIAFTLGRHTNDYMTSFYSRTPSGFFVETGFGGRIIDPETWEPHETFGGPSFWGHDRPYLSDEKRREYDQMREKLAKQGRRAPNCPWLEGHLSKHGEAN